MKRFNILLVLALSLSLVGCLKTRSQIGNSETTRVSNAQDQSDSVRPVSAEIQIQELHTELRRMNGQIEALEYQMTNQQKREEEEGEKLPVEDLVEQMRMFEQTLNSLEQRIKSLESGRGASISAGPTAEDNLFGAAEKIFDAKDWRAAIVKYQEYRDKYPKGQHWGNATYKIGVCFQEMNLLTEAKSFFEEAIQKVPKSAAARKSQYRLNQLKKEST